MYPFCALEGLGVFFVVGLVPQYLFTLSFHISPTHFPSPRKKNENIKAPAVLLDLGVSDEVEIWAAETANV